MTVEELKAENERLHDLVIEQRADIKKIGSGIWKTLQGIGLDKDSLSCEKKAKKRIQKSIPIILSDAAIDPDGLSEKFSHIGSFLPLLEKYKDLLEDITDG